MLPHFISGVARLHGGFFSIKFIIFLYSGHLLKFVELNRKNLTNTSLKKFSQKLLFLYSL